LKTFAECFHAHEGRLIDRWEHYFQIYDRHLSKFQKQFCTLLEIGVSHGGSLQVWKDYLPHAHITGVDIDPRCQDFVEGSTGVMIADQGNAEHMEAIASPMTWDIVIDDGSHVLEHQVTSFNAIWPHVNPGGVYVIEDCHSGWPDIQQTGGFVTKYPWVMVIERPKRIIRGKPSREMREDELEAQRLHPDF
jgi:cephalosporin hydroxylase